MLEKVMQTSQKIMENVAKMGSKINAKSMKNQSTNRCEKKMDFGSLRARSETGARRERDARADAGGTQIQQDR